MPGRQIPSRIRREAGHSSPMLDWFVGHTGCHFRWMTCGRNCPGCGKDVESPANLGARPSDRGPKWYQFTLSERSVIRRDSACPYCSKPVKTRQRSNGIELAGRRPQRTSRVERAQERRAPLTVNVTLHERHPGIYDPATITSSFLTDLTPGTFDVTCAAFSRCARVSAVP